jgi:hypothetical protein
VTEAPGRNCECLTDARNLDKQDELYNNSPPPTE